MLALPVAVLGSVAAFYGLRSGPEADDPVRLRARASALLDQIITAETRALQQLLGDTGRPEPADIGFTRTPPDIAAGTWRAYGGPDSGSLNTVAEFYESLELGRLVVLGEPGSGKTVLMIRLLLDLAHKAHGEQFKVPVRLSLPSFSDSPQQTRDVRERLDAWIADQLTSVHGVPRSVAEALVRGGWILPLLDGLDEMDGDTADPRRAVEVITALNTAGGPRGWPVVVACREESYRNLPASTRLQDAPVVTMGALEVEQIIGWLTHRFPDPKQPDRVQARWRPVLTRIRTNPAGRLARFLSSPLHLYLAVSVFQDPGGTSEPKALCALHEPQLKQFLYARLIPAATEHRPGPDRHRYQADEVNRWLSTFANHLAWMRAYGYSGVDIHLYELWRTTGTQGSQGRRVRLLAAALYSALTILIVILVFLHAWFFGERTSFRDHPGRWFLIGATLLPLGLMSFRFTAITWTRTVVQIDPRMFLSGAGLRKILRTAFKLIPLGCVVGILLGAAASLLEGTGVPPDIVFGGLVIGAVGGFLIGGVTGVIGTTSRLQAAKRPSDPERKIRSYELFSTLVIGLAILTLGKFFMATGDSVVVGLAAGLATYFGGGPVPRLRRKLALREMVHKRGNRSSSSIGPMTPVSCALQGQQRSSVTVKSKPGSRRSNQAPPTRHELKSHWWRWQELAGRWWAGERFRRAGVDGIAAVLAVPQCGEGSAATVAGGVPLPSSSKAVVPKIPPAASPSGIEDRCRCAARERMRRR
ncbi:NACHT domain-containing protein [Amycolatopsis alba]|uniref:NACHT domain-containing protein n=1 Tax=Amycolatopsis alba DSM 44262 TaxID=1125972 RepID=A0A229R911_AMYAL|nr:NACHT domain-containing protein [Amycolatopsis alba]OXM43117.1 NACHT domain-containing protein [Amycolatopsis alba DSM 44262]